MDMSAFTNLYSVPKTLRFELKPVGKTAEWLKLNQVFQKDKQIEENYQEAKFYFDKLHARFIEESLQDATLDYSKYWDVREQTKKIKQEEEKLRKQIVDMFKSRGNEWIQKYADRGIKVKGKGIGFLFEKSVVDILQYEFPKQKEIFEKFDGFFTYFNNFNTSRENFYSDKAHTTAVSNRCINENLRKFCQNKQNFQEKYGVLELSGKQEKIFDLNFFNSCLNQAGIDRYNDLIGEINSLVNEYRQKSGNKIPFLKLLFKQILGERTKRETEQDDFIKLGTDEEVFPLVELFMEETRKSLKKASAIFDNFYTRQAEFDLDRIFVKGTAINTISNKWFTSWNVFANLLPKNSSRKKIKDFVSFAEIRKALVGNDAIELFKPEYREFDGKDNYQTFLNIWSYELKQCVLAIKDAENTVKKEIQENKVYTNRMGNLKNGEDGEVQKEIIKDYADAALSYSRMMQYFALQKGRNKVSDLDEDANFYNEYNQWLDSDQTWLYYNELRNYLTRKPYKTDKFKLNFENGTLLDGWDRNKEPDNYGILFRKNEKYLLGIMKKGCHRAFDLDRNEELSPSGDEETIEKIFYKQMADPKRDFPKGCLSKKGKDTFAPSDEVIRIYDNKTYKTDNKRFSTDDLHTLIDYFKNCIPLHPSWSLFDFVFSDTSTYTNLNDFYDEVDRNSYKIWSESVSQSYVDKKVADGELYLFEIYNQDFSKEAQGKKNLHTVYFQKLFEEGTPGETMVKLNGQAEIFFRPASITDPEKEVRTDKQGAHEITRNKRYTQDKIMFHCPITLNNNAIGDEKLNRRVNETINQSDKLRIIGIDRGEKHLMYISMIDEQGNILKVESLNKIDNGNKTFDYHEQLDKKEKARDKQRKSWQAIENIKDFKRGYMSQAIHAVSEMIFECLDDGIVPMVVFEDLNRGFKRGRFKIEKQVYQNFELALATKLNYLVSKKRKNHLRALQLTEPITSFQDIGKQCGIIYYIPASYTSAICPVCGFRKRVYGFYFKNIDQAKKLLEEHEFEIKYNGTSFAFSCRASSENNKKNNGNELFAEVELAERLEFGSDVERLVNKRTDDNKSWTTVSFDPTQELLHIFDGKVDLDRDIVGQILQGEFEQRFYKQLIFIINTILSLRNSHTAEDRDFIACPSCGFHSEKNLKRLETKYTGEGDLEFNGDANGAYNIARKGILLAQKIMQYGQKNGSLDDFGYADLSILMQEWDKFVQLSL